MQALLITDADVIFEPAALRTMTRHLADPRVGAVTCYIKEGSRPGNYLTRFIGYEYVTAQAAARRGQNVLGALACLAGGAQLHSRANLRRPRRPDRHHLAGRGHHHHVRDPAARPPGRVRAARHLLGRGAGHRRGPVEAAAALGARQRPGHHPVPAGSGSGRAAAHRLGGLTFGVLWFCLFLQPVFMITSSAALLTLYFTGSPRAWPAFHVLWVTNAATYLFITGFTLLIDPQTGRRTWRQAVLFPGLVNLAIIAESCFPRPRPRRRLTRCTRPPAWPPRSPSSSYAWLGASLAVGYLVKVVEPHRGGRLASAALLYLAGYGSLLCACTFASYVKEARRADMTLGQDGEDGKGDDPDMTPSPAARGCGTRLRSRQRSARRAHGSSRPGGEGRRRPRRPRRPPRAARRCTCS